VNSGTGVTTINWSALNLTTTGTITAGNLIANSSTATSSVAAGGLAIGTTTPHATSLFTVGTSSPLIAVDRVSGKIGFGGVNTSPARWVFGSGSNPNINPNINLLVTDGSDARAGVAVSDRGLFFKAPGSATASAGLYAYNYAAGAPMDLHLQEFGRYVSIGTSTPRWPLQLASSTAPQFALSDGSNTSNHWTMRNAGGILYIATSSPNTFATSTLSALTIQPASAPSLAIGTTTCSGQFCLGPLTPGASSTEAYGKWQADFYNSAGTRSCMFVVGTTLTIIAGACN
jgi:hypothetical protein